VTSEIEKRAAFRHIRYAQVWEDADVLVEALSPKPGEVVVSIASAGDNALALLAAGPDRVIATDLSLSQLACVRLRIAAYRTLNHAALLELMGSRPSARRDELLAQCAQRLADQDQAFWREHRRLVRHHGVGGVGKFERYFRLFRRILLPLVHGRETVAELLSPKDHVDRASFYAKRWDTPEWRRLLRFFFSRPVMGRLGRDPAFFSHVAGSVADHVAKLTREALVNQDPSQNPYLAWILTGRHFEALPRALRPEQFELIRERTDRLELRHGSVESLAEAGIRADAFNLSDIFEYMSPSAHEKAYADVLAASRPGARLAYWNMMAPRRAPATFAARVIDHVERAQALKKNDRAFFYRDFILEEVR
jgi:S-adenosylmethionine-diacylglycerol 3-amino-3-carboxypropyl transferase